VKIGVPIEVSKNETRVALTPAVIPTLTADGHEVSVESGAGERASFLDAEYEKAGARIVKDAEELYATSDLIIKVQPPTHHPHLNKHEAHLFREGSTYIGFLWPFLNLDVVGVFQKRRVTTFAMEFMPRIARAQSMDALSSQATITGYKAVLIAADRLWKMFPLLMTAAGTIHSSTVLVLGAGVAGLQAIATAKRLGARVEAFDPRPAVREQVQSVGGTFIEMELPEDVETKGGYAKELSAEFIRREREVLSSRLPKVDVVICAAQVFGKRAPILITEEMVKLMRPGSVIVDAAIDQGGNCELTEAGRTIEKHGVVIIGPVNLPSTVPVHASELYSRNVTNFLQQVFRDKRDVPNFEDQIVREACLLRDGKIVNEMLRSAFESQAVSGHPRDII